MNCKGCYRDKQCWACVVWFGCSKTEEEKLAEDCFKCDKKEHCKKEKEE